MRISKQEYFPLFMAVAIFLSILSFSCSELKNPSVVSENGCNLCHQTLADVGGLHTLVNETTYGYDCTYCHKGNSMDEQITQKTTHKNSTVEVVFDSLLLAEQFPAADSMEITNTTCSNIPCHGYGREGKHDVIWNVNAKLKEKLDCRGCHETKATPMHMAGVSCEICHKETAVDSLTIFNFEKHINGNVDL